MREVIIKPEHTANMAPMNCPPFILSTNNDTALKMIIAMDNTTPKLNCSGFPRQCFTTQSIVSISHGSNNFMICTNDALPNINPMFVDNDPNPCNAPSANMNADDKPPLSKLTISVPPGTNIFTIIAITTPHVICAIVTNVIASNRGSTSTESNNMSP